VGLYVFFFELQENFGENLSIIIFVQIFLYIQLPRLREYAMKGRFTSPLTILVIHFQLYTTTIFPHSILFIFGIFANTSSSSLKIENTTFRFEENC